ncbi:hypothetical protein CFII68_23178 [Pseudomonas sp. CFII68]|nr:hypothetical protein CFII68_23178 [Pseudomonas sp. CFII68]
MLDTWEQESLGVMGGESAVTEAQFRDSIKPL